MKADNKVSIIVPVYNAGKFLERCLNSIINQTYKNLDVILINDGSKDDSLQICLNYAKTYDFVKVIDQENKGVSTARNKGLLSAKGKYITFIDADDYVESNFVECLLDTIENEKADLAMCSYFNEDEDSHIQSISNAFAESININLEKENEFLYSQFIYSTLGIFSIFNKIFKSELIKKHKILFSTEKNHAEDFEFCIQYVNCIKHFSYIKQSLYHYVRNDNSLTNSFHIDQMSHHSDWLKIIEENIPYAVIEKNRTELYRTTLLEVNDFLNRAYRNNVKVKINELENNIDIKNMIKNLKLTEASSMSNKFLLFSLKTRWMFMYHIYQYLRFH